MDFDKIKDDLVALNREIEKATNEKSEAVGARRSLMESLKKDFGFSTTKEAENEIDALNDDIDFEKEKLQEIYNKIKREFKW